jgi:hypothetical protein
MSASRRRPKRCETQSDSTYPSLGPDPTIACFIVPARSTQTSWLCEPLSPRPVVETFDHVRLAATDPPALSLGADDGCDHAPDTLLACMHASPISRRDVRVRASLASRTSQPAPCYRRVGFRIRPSRPARCSLALRPECSPSRLAPVRLLRLLPAGVTVYRAGFTPTGCRTLYGAMQDQVLTGAESYARHNV